VRGTIDQNIKEILSQDQHSNVDDQNKRVNQPRPLTQNASMTTTEMFLHVNKENSAV